MAETERRVTFKTMFEVAVGLIGALAMILWWVASDQIKEAKAGVKQLQLEKVDKTDFLRAIDKIDKLQENDAAILKALTDHEINSARRMGVK